MILRVSKILPPDVRGGYETRLRKPARASAATVGSIGALSALQETRR